MVRYEELFPGEWVFLFVKVEERNGWNETRF